MGQSGEQEEQYTEEDPVVVHWDRPVPMTFGSVLSGIFGSGPTPPDSACGLSRWQFVPGNTPSGVTLRVWKETVDINQVTCLDRVIQHAIAEGLVAMVQALIGIAFVGRLTLGLKP